jgi:putative CocE/NonD family hydrolase
MHRLFYAAVLYVTVGSFAVGQQFDFPEAAIVDPALQSKAVSDLARQVVAIYKDEDRGKYLDNLFRLQIMAGRYQDALHTISSLREVLGAANPLRGAWVNVQYEIYARALARQESDRLPFEEAYKQSFRNGVGELPDPAAALVVRALGVDSSFFDRDLKRDLDRQKGRSVISLADAVTLVHDYLPEKAYQAFAPLTPILIAEDDARRYVIEKDVRLKMPDGGTVCALIVRPRAASVRLPTLLTFTIYAEANNIDFSARPSASHGYIGVEGLVRGKGCSPDKPIPYERDASDLAALIDWISAQPWSDGRVGMYGGSYSGGSAWAATKRMPKALKAIDVGAPVAPGIDVPMEGNVFWNFLYPWPFYTTDVKGVDDAVYNDSARWKRQDHDWYVSGRAYRDLDKIDGTPNPIFDKWIAHPNYDAYWQSLIPYQKDFARINIPVLQTAGYYYGGPGAAVYYFTEHYKYRSRAEHYLVIGPYDHPGAQHGTVGLLGQDFDELAGYKLDPVALVDLEDLRYEWFDYILKGGPKPALLQDKVNYEVTGANCWKHAPTLAAMTNHTLRFYLSSTRSGETYSLTNVKPAKDVFIAQTIDLADRSDVDRVSPGGGVQDKAVDTWNGIEFVSDPLSETTVMSGLFSGHLDLVSNKKDFDFEIDLYEQTPKGDYVQLAPFWTRASYIGDRSHRQLLMPGRRQRLDFYGNRLMSREFQQGSRLVLVLSVIKERGRQINYGTGRDVSDETIQDAKEPLEIKWFNDSFIDAPVGR